VSAQSRFGVLGVSASGSFGWGKESSRLCSITYFRSSAGISFRKVPQSVALVARLLVSLAVVDFFFRLLLAHVGAPLESECTKTENRNAAHIRRHCRGDYLRVFPPHRDFRLKIPVRPQRRLVALSGGPDAATVRPAFYARNRAAEAGS